MFFEFHYTIEYDTRLDFADMAAAAETLAMAADETTDGNRSKWGLFIWGSEVGVGFDCSHCRDRFIQIYERFVQSEDDEVTPPASMKRVRGRSLPTRDASVTPNLRAQA